MKILSHRGYWKNNEEKNTSVAFSRSFSLGFGTETDVRDCAGRLVISHDMPLGTELEVDVFLDEALDAWNRLEQLTLALNVKADGMAGVLKSMLLSRPQLDAFVFDMSVPDMKSYFENDIPVFTRMSEVERDPAWLDKSAGVWLDGFFSEWYETENIVRLLETGKRVCVVSSELHKRDFAPLWEKLLPLKTEDRLLLCTDVPEHAKDFFCAN
ncbi:hypothetical protein [Zoogloea sp.]|uniref:hypothetical protein n=1 Tax=Zoogloea sp. TaxID=49181 RepID=UPI0035B09A17